MVNKSERLEAICFLELGDDQSYVRTELIAQHACRLSTLNVLGGRLDDEGEEKE